MQDFPHCGVMTSIQQRDRICSHLRHQMGFLLIFTYQPNLSVNTGVHASLHLNCHHQIVNSSFNLNIC